MPKTTLEEVIVMTTTAQEGRVDWTRRVKPEILATAIREWIKESLPKEECHIIWNTAKRFECEGCSMLYTCKYYARNQYRQEALKSLGIEGE